MNIFREYLEKQQELFSSNKKEMVKTDLEHSKNKRFEWFKLLEKKLKESNNKEIIEIRKKLSGYSESLIKMDFKAFRLPKFGYEPKFNFKFSGNDIIFNVFPTIKIDSNNFNEIFKYIIKCSNFKSNFKSNETKKSESNDSFLPLKFKDFSNVKFRNTTEQEIGNDLISATLNATYQSFQEKWSGGEPVVIKSNKANSYISSISKSGNKIFFKIDEDMAKDFRNYMGIDMIFEYKLKGILNKMGSDKKIKNANFDLENGIIKITLKEDNNE